MSNYHTLKHVLFVAILTLFAALLLLGIRIHLSCAQKPWTNSQAADGVLGQVDFTSTISGTSASAFDNPFGVAVDPTTGKLFVSDLNNNRGLRFSSINAALNDSAAEAVLGQVDFTSNMSGTTAATLYGPSHISVDEDGRLWVADFHNHRVLRFDNAASKGNGTAADGVLGQPDFTSNTPATTRSGMSRPVGVHVDAPGTLWTADTLNNRVLRFDNAASKANGAAADGVLGQPDFTSNTPATTQSGMSIPNDLTVDGLGNLFVTDCFNNRVLRFDNAASKANGAAADGVLGQPDFISNTDATTQSGMAFPRSIAVDDYGRLYVTESHNHRLLSFNDAAAKGNGAPADNVLGQADFATGAANGGGISARTLNSPRGVFFDNATLRLWVTDRQNQRVLRFESSYKTYLPLILRDSE
jgi:sugar lactone lactonase YvrE